MRNRTATVTAPTIAVAPNGHAFELSPGTYPIVEISGAAQRGEMYIRVDGPSGGVLVGFSPTYPNVTISDEG